MENKKNMDLENKINGFEIPHHPNLWGNIENSIANGNDRLYNFHVNPPEICWEKIQKALLQKKSKPFSLPLKIASISTWIRVAAIVVGIAILSITAINTSIRNSLIHSFRGVDIKAALPDSQNQLHKIFSPIKSSPNNIKATIPDSTNKKAETKIH